MDNRDLLLISNKQLKENSYLIPDDRYGMASVMNEHVRETMLSCPNAENDKTVLVLALLNNIVVGRALQLGSRLKCNGHIIRASAGGGRVEVTPECRGKGIGTSIVKWRMNTDEFDYIIGALYSTMMLPILKKQGFVIFEKPLFIYFHNLRSKLKALGLKGSSLSCCSLFANIPLRIFDFVNSIRRIPYRMRYDVRKETTIPQWAGEMATNDGHQYQEFHDTAWLQWNLDHNLNGYEQDIQSFYAIYDKKTKEPKGFFFTKERYEEAAGRYSDVVKGTICEWASIDGNLTEAAIHLLALPTFTKEVYYINAVAVEDASAKKYKRLGLLRHGNFQVSFLDKNKKLEQEAFDVNKWRIRYGYANSIIC